MGSFLLPLRPHLPFFPARQQHQLLPGCVTIVPSSLLFLSPGSGTCEQPLGKEKVPLSTHRTFQVGTSNGTSFSFSLSSTSSFHPAHLFMFSWLHETIVTILRSLLIDSWRMISLSVSYHSVPLFITPSLPLCLCYWLSGSCKWCDTPAHIPPVDTYICSFPSCRHVHFFISVPFHEFTCLSFLWLFPWSSPTSFLSTYSFDRFLLPLPCIAPTSYPLIPR